MTVQQSPCRTFRTKLCSTRACRFVWYEYAPCRFGQTDSQIERQRMDVRGLSCSLQIHTGSHKAAVRGPTCFRPQPCGLVLNPAVYPAETRSLKYLMTMTFHEYTVFMNSYKQSDKPRRPRSGPPAPPLTAVRLLDQVRERIRYKHYSLRTEQQYVYWVRAFVRFHGLRHPHETGAAEVGHRGGHGVVSPLDRL